MTLLNVRRANPGDAVDIAKTQIGSWRTTYKGIVSDEYLDSMSVEDRTEMWQQAIRQSKVYVLEEDSGATVGFAAGGAHNSTKFEDYDSELYAMYLYKDSQRIGGGKKLFNTVIADLVEKGHKNMLLGVLADNPACAFYEHMGGTVIGEETVEIGDEKHKEVYYGWKDIDKK
ncbi:GNAT family N-acetyltransferase [Corticicoccus populi]|uniref:GNAT family N-acetyltransferase n=1 Tax=Corticicoccus populi TaxID=1812821 RepID=A0ABW5WZU9_9STAP